MYKMFNCLGEIYSPVCNIDGIPVKRTIQEYPYSYDPFLIWSNNYHKDDHVLYSDRLYQWNFEKFNRCCYKVWKNMGQWFDERSPKSIEKFLSLYLEKPICLTGIEQGCNVSNGYPYWIFFYKDV